MDYSTKCLRDLIGSGQYDTDKADLYIRVYSELFSPIRYKVDSLLELGIDKGGSLKLWRDYFPNAVIHGVDLKLPDIARDRIVMHEANQRDAGKLFGKPAGYNEFDIIIDDGSHLGEDIEESFNGLFTLLRSGGYYCIEDWGVGYFPNWPDSPLGFIISLINRVGEGKDVASVSFHSGVGIHNGHLAVIKKRAV